MGLQGLGARRAPRAWGPAHQGPGAFSPQKPPKTSQITIFRKPPGGSLAKAWVSAETAASEVGTWRETKPGSPSLEGFPSPNHPTRPPRSADNPIIDTRVVSILFSIIPPYRNPEPSSVQTGFKVWGSYYLHLNCFWAVLRDLGYIFYLLLGFLLVGYLDPGASPDSAPCNARLKTIDPMRSGLLVFRETGWIVGTKTILGNPKRPRLKNLL